MGKSPLRLVLARTNVARGVWKEKLECGHELTTFQEYLRADNSTLIPVEPSAARRRCQKCKPAVAPILQTKAEITADQKRRELIRARQYQFGSLFDKLCFENGEMRPGMTELQAANSGSRVGLTNPHSASNPHDAGDGVSLPDSIPSPKKPVQSVKRERKRRSA